MANSKRRLPDSLNIWLQLLSRILLWMVLLAGVMLFLSDETLAGEALSGQDKPVETQTSATTRLLALKPTEAKQHWRFDKGIESGQQLRISGVNESDDSARLLIRIDSHRSSNYFTRFNREQLLPKGEFSFTLSLDNLRTERKQPFGSDEIRKLFLSTLNGKISWQAVSLEPSPKLPAGLIGWDFGPQDQAKAAGFQQVSYPLSADNIQQGIRLKGTIRNRNRPYFDPALADGFEGLTQLSLPLENGLWKVRLWVDDIGEWEYLPHALERAITINGQPVLLQKLDAQQWLSQYYLNQPQLPDKPSQSANKEGWLKQLQNAFWSSFARERGHPVDALIEVKDQRLNLAFSSPDTAGRFISALLVSPANNLEQLAAGKQAFEAYDQQRLARFQEQWPVIANPQMAQYLPKAISAPLSASSVASARSETLHWADREEITLRLNIPKDAGQLQRVNLPLKNLKLFRVQTGLRRAGGQEKALQPQLFLHPIDPDDPPEVTSHSQQWVITGQVQFAEDLFQNAKPGFQVVGLNTGLESPVADTSTGTGTDTGLTFSHLQIPLTIKRLPLELPSASKPVGIYLDYAPHLSWFQYDEQQSQADCDYKVLRELGLTGVAPALPTPVKGAEARFKRAAQSPLLQGLLPPFPAYTPVKRLLTDNSQQARDSALIQLDKLKNTFPLLIWSLADEPGLHLKSDEKLDLFRSQLKQTLPEARVLAQLNHSHHDQLSSQYDAVLINQGYGLNSQRLASLKQADTQTYLYNLPHLRFASGLYLWRSGAEGFWQWHGRMPTAHPYDPTDGREDDVQMLMPTVEVCQPPVLHSSLLGIRQGINDLRWLEWLMQNANQDIDSAILLQQIRQQISLDWSRNTEKESIKNNQLTHNLISQIKQLAQPVQSPE